MPSLSNQGARPLAIPAPSAALPPGAARHAPAALAGGRVAASESDGSVHLSARALTSGAALDAGRDTMAAAQQFMQRISEAVFGDAGRNARFDFEAISLESTAGFTANQVYASGPDGSTSSASLALTESAHFVGTGLLTLADGKTYDVEVEVKYQAAATLAASETVQQATPDMILTGKQLPAIKYPGGIEDLFKLLGRELSTESGDPGKLTLRLMRLVDRAALLAPRLQEDHAPARQSAANAYASTAIEA